LLGGTINLHGKHLIAAVGGTRRLENKLLPVIGKVRFGVRAAKRQLAHVSEMPFVGMSQRIQSISVCY
jgi:hypothetical protein